MAVGRRRSRDARRRRLGQNFLRPERARQLVTAAGVGPGELVLEIGPGDGAITRELLRQGAEVVAVEADPRLARRLHERTAGVAARRLRVVSGDFLSAALPGRPFRVVASLPFGETTAILARLLDDPSGKVLRADLIVQWEVARKRSTSPPATLRSVAWAPWWEFRLGPRIAAAEFRPVPRVDAGVLVVTRRDPPLLPPAMATAWASFVRRGWPFAQAQSR